MRQLFLLLLFLILSNFKAQTYVLIPDHTFASLLDSAYVPEAMKGDSLNIYHPLVTTLTKTIITRNVNDTVLTYGNIKNLSGIQYFSSLNYLDCSFNSSLTSIPQISDSLKTLICSYTAISSLPVLSKNLSYLDYSYTRYSRVPALPLNLKVLDCSANKIIVLPLLPDSLEILRCDHNLLTCLPPLPNNFKALSCSWNNLTFLPRLPEGLLELYCIHNQINCFTPFPSSIRPPYITGTFPQTDTLWYNLRFEKNPVNCIPNYLPNAMRPSDMGYPLCGNGECALESIETSCSAELEVYPNPTSGKFSVKFDKSLPFTLEVFDLSGKFLIAFEGLQTGTFDLTFLPMGVYPIALNTSEGVFRKKLIIIKK